MICYQPGPSGIALHVAVDGTKTALRVDPDGRHWHRWSTAGVDEGRGTAGGVGERVDSGPVEERMDEEHRPESTGDGPEQRAGATGSTGTGFEVGEVAGEVVSVVAVGTKAVDRRVR